MAGIGGDSGGGVDLEVDASGVGGAVGVADGEGEGGFEGRYGGDGGIKGAGTGNVAGREGRLLADGDAGGNGFNGRLAVGGKRIGAVVHDGTVVVGADIITYGGCFVEVTRHAGGNIRIIDSDICVAIFAGLFVEETDGVADFMNDGAGAAVRAEHDDLTGDADVADVRPTFAVIGGVGEADIVRFAVAGADGEAAGEAGIPMIDGVGDAGLIGEGGIDFVGDDTGGPAVVGAGHADAFALGGELLFRDRLDGVGRAEDDIAIIDGHAVAHLIGHDVAAEDGLAGGADFSGRRGAGEPFEPRWREVAEFGDEEGIGEGGGAGKVEFEQGGGAGDGVRPEGVAVERADVFVDGGDGAGFAGFGERPEDEAGAGREA